MGIEKSKGVEITKVDLTLVNNDEHLKAFVNVTFGDVFIVRSFKVLTGNKGLFVAMPSRKGKDGTFKDIAHPVNQEFRRILEDHILAEYVKFAGNT